MTQDELDSLINRCIPHHVAAADLVCRVSRLVRHADDCVDRDAGHPSQEMSEAMAEALVALPSNSFYLEHQTALAPLLSTIFVVWHASDVYTGSPIPQQRLWAFGARDLISLFLFHVANLVGGHESARRAVLAFVSATVTRDSETLADWEREHAPQIPNPPTNGDA